MSRMYEIEFEGMTLLVDDELYAEYVRNGNKLPSIRLEYTTVAGENKTEHFIFTEDKE